MLTYMIDAFEKRDVATVDIPGAFLQTKMPKEEKDVHVILDGRMAETIGKNCARDLPRVRQPKMWSEIHILPCKCCHLWDS